MVGARISWHCQRNDFPGWLTADIEQAAATSERPVYVKLIDPPEQNPFSHCNIRVIGRTYIPDNESNDLVWMGRDGAEAWFQMWLPFYQARPWTWCWEGPNEPQPMSNSLFRQKLMEFTQRLGQLMRQHSLRFVGLNLAVGWPDVDDAVDLGPCLTDCDYIGLHEYAWPAMWDGNGYWTLRYRRTVDEWQEAGFEVPKIIIGECGLEQAVTGAGHCGWLCQSGLSAWEYMEQLKWYDDCLRQDGIETATIFIATPEPDWLTFDINQELSGLLRGYIMGNPPDPTEDRAKGFYVSWWQGNPIDWQRVWDAGYRYVMIRATYIKDGALAVDDYFEDNWAGAGEVGLLRGVWHYLTEEPAGQAPFFVNNVPEIPELGYYGDIEDESLTGAKVRAFLQAVDKHLATKWGDIGLKCNVYTSRYKWDSQIKVPAGVEEGRLLWVANWTDADEPILPDDWDTWEFWQWTAGTETIPGVPGKVLLDRFNGTEQELYDKYGEPAPPPSGEIKYYDFAGYETTEEWFREKFGDFQIIVDPNAVYHVAEMHAATGYATFRCRVLDENGNPATWEAGVYSWPDAPPLPGSGWDEKGVVSEVEADGWFNHAMGTGEYYFPPERGPAQCWVYGPGASDYVDGIGMLGGTNHDHFDVVMRAGEPPPVELCTLVLSIVGSGGVEFDPEPDDWDGDDPQWWAGTAVTLQANPAEGWKFDRWAGDLEGTTNPGWLVIDSDKAVACHFVEVSGCDVEAARAKILEAMALLEQALADLDGC